MTILFNEIQKVSTILADILYFLQNSRQSVRHLKRRKLESTLLVRAGPKAVVVEWGTGSNIPKSFRRFGINTFLTEKSSKLGSILTCILNTNTIQFRIYGIPNVPNPITTYSTAVQLSSGSRHF